MMMDTKAKKAKLAKQQYYDKVRVQLINFMPWIFCYRQQISHWARLISTFLSLH
jgi:hypothetical protein